MRHGKRIAILMTSAVSFNQLMRMQLEFLCSQGLRLDLYTGGPDHEFETLTERGIGRVYYVPMRRSPNLVWDFICLGWLVAVLAWRRYDAVVYSTPKAMFLGALASFLTRQRNRTAWVRGRAYENFSGAKRRFYVALDRLTFRLSHKIVFVSRSLIHAYREDSIHVGTKGMIVGYGSSNGVDTERFKPVSAGERSALRAQLGLSPSDFVILAVGRIRQDKGVGEVLELARRMADIANLKAVFLGATEDEELADEIHSYGDRVRLYSPRPHAEQFFQVADLHLFLSHREGFGNVAIEAAAVGVPTFAFNVVGVRDSVIDGATGQLFAFGDIDSLEAAIRSAVDDPDALREKFSKARKVVGERFAQARVWEGNASVFLGASPEAHVDSSR